MAFSLYVLECAEGSLYVGHTDNLEARMIQHHDGACGGYTARRRPVRLVHSEQFETRYEALAMERKVKKWSRAKKQAWMRGDWQEVGRLAKGRNRHERKP